MTEMNETIEKIDFMMRKIEETNKLIILIQEKVDKKKKRVLKR